MDEKEKREKAITELKKLIAEQRARIDPAILKRAEAAALASQGLPPKTMTPQAAAPKTPGAVPVAPAGSVPYDREKAAKAIELFLKKHSNSREFQLKLLERLKKGDH